MCLSLLLCLFLPSLSSSFPGSQGDKLAPGWAKCAWCWEPDGTGRVMEGAKDGCSKRCSAEAMVWQGSVGELALHTNNPLVLRGPKAVHTPLPGACAWIKTGQHRWVNFRVEEKWGKAVWMQQEPKRGKEETERCDVSQLLAGRYLVNWI